MKRKTNHSPNQCLALVARGKPSTWFPRGGHVETTSTSPNTTTLAILNSFWLHNFTEAKLNTRMCKNNICLTKTNLNAKCKLDNLTLQSSQ